MNSLSQHDAAPEIVPAPKQKGFAGDARNYFHILAVSALGVFADTAKGQTPSLQKFLDIPGTQYPLTTPPNCSNSTNASDVALPPPPASVPTTPVSTSKATNAVPSVTPYIRYQRGEFGVMQTRYVQTQNGVVAVSTSMQNTKGPSITATGAADVRTITEQIHAEATIIQQVLKEHTKLALEDRSIPFVRYNEVNNYRNELRIKGCNGEMRTLIMDSLHGFQSSRGEKPACTGGAFCNCKKK